MMSLIWLENLFKHLSQQLSHAACRTRLQGRPVIVVDGTGLSMSDTVENQEKWPQQKHQKSGCGFPEAALCACFNLDNGALLSYALGNKKSHELPMLRQQCLHKDVALFFESKHTSPDVGFESVDGGHGRIETRSVRASSDIDWLKERYPKWRGLRSIVAVTAERECNGKVSDETRYFICSLDAEDPKRLGQIVRAHWGIENKLHWVLDYAFDEDSQRNRKGNSAANMAVIRHIALNLIGHKRAADFHGGAGCCRAAIEEWAFAT